MVGGIALLNSSGSDFVDGGKGWYGGGGWQETTPGASDSIRMLGMAMRVYILDCTSSTSGLCNKQDVAWEMLVSGTRER